MLCQFESQQWTPAAMAQQLGIPGSHSSQGRFADAFVIFSVTVLSMALGAWFLLQLGLSLWPGMAAALTVYTVLLLLHLLVRRSLLDDGGTEAREEMQWIAGEPDLGPAPGDRRDGPSLGLGPAADEAAQNRLSLHARAGHPHTLPEASAEVAFHYRPRDAGALGSGRLAARAASASAAAGGALDSWQDPPEQSPSERNVELIQDLIKKLADELSDAPPASSATAAGEVEDAMLTRSLAALDTAAASMRVAVGEPPNAGVSSRWPEKASTEHGTPAGARPARSGAAPTAPPLPDPQVARAAEAMSTNRMEVLLEPIQALNEGRARHFEISARFLDVDGAGIETAALQRTGLVPRMDAAGVVRAARVAQKLGERGREGNVLTSIATESLTDPGFIDVVSTQAKAARGMGLILSLGQAAARDLTDVQSNGLSTLRVAGCRFALEQVADLDMDFTVLKPAGFAFVKLEAPVFLEGLPHAGSKVAASDLNRFFADFGLTLIVARIEDDWMLARILGFGVQFGMGGLFGGPKLVKAEVVEEPAAA
jgi:EAL domain-containing protein (putative c-di-GMP-specific phosphodiesterase class I)